MTQLNLQRRGCPFELTVRTRGGPIRNAASDNKSDKKKASIKRKPEEPHCVD